eukprot:g3648.t1
MKSKMTNYSYPSGHPETSRPWSSAKGVQAARALAGEIKQNLERDSEFLSFAALKSPTTFPRLMARARELVLNPPPEQVEHDAALLDVYYWLCKSLVASPTPLDPDVMLAYSKRRLEMGFPEAVSGNTLAQQAFRNVSELMGRKSKCSALTLDALSVLLPCFTSRRAVENVYEAYGGLFDKVARGRLLRQHQKISDDVALQRWVPYILHAYAQMLKAIRRTDVEQTVTASTPVLGQQQAMDYAHLAVLALSVRLSNVVDLPFWEGIGKVVRAKANDPGAFPARSLGTLATAFSTSPATAATGQRRTTSCTSSRGEGSSCSSARAAQEGVLQELVLFLENVFFERFCELSYHEITHLAEAIPVDRHKRRLLCEKILDSSYLFPPTYLVSLFQALKRWPEHRELGAAAGARTLCSGEQDLEAAAGCTSQGQHVTESYYLKARSMLARQLSVKSRYFKTHDIERILKNCAELVVGGLHLSLQRELMRRVRDFTPAEVRRFAVALRQKQHCKEWFRPEDFV